MDFQKLCMHCMGTLDESGSCTSCGKSGFSVWKAPLLSEKTVIDSRYVVGECKEILPDSVRYIGLDLQSNSVVTICEFLPQKLVERGQNQTFVSVRGGCSELYSKYLKSFVNLWSALASLNGVKALPQVRRIFYANSTAYVIYDCQRYITLSAFLKSKSQLFDWKKVRGILRPVMQSVELLHEKGIVHGAISPDNLLVSRDGLIHITGFSISQVYSEKTFFSTAGSMEYSPLEVFENEGAVGEYSDVYCLMAIAYRMLTGAAPQPSVQRAQNDTLVIPKYIAKTLSQSAINTLARALQVQKENRLQSIKLLLAEINDENRVAFEGASENNNAKQTEAAPEQQAPIKPEEEPEKTGGAADPAAPKKQDENKNILTLALKSFLIFFVVTTIGFCVLYTTVLYKSVDVPVLNTAFKSFSFLPLNSREETTTEPSTTKKKKSEKKVKVADFSQLSYHDIISNDTFNNNFKIKYVFEKNSTVEKYGVISQSIEHGKSVKKGTEITIVISDGKSKKLLADVIGMDYDEAYNLLKQDGFVVEKNTVANDGTKTEGQVFTMSLVAGLEFDEGTKVVLSVYDKAAETTQSTTEGSQASSSNAQ